ncbi:MAG: hypothetical protein K9M57_06450 [Phycisphaerae bacterium]|nr:hypothetical protein [Phycisphaerae bacterium]
MVVHYKGLIGIKGGTPYRLVVLPRFDTMTPAFLKDIIQFVKKDATVVGYRPSASPSMEGYPVCDKEVKRLAEKHWGKPPYAAQRGYGCGRCVVCSLACGYYGSGQGQGQQASDQDR